MMLLSGWIDNIVVFIFFVSIYIGTDSEMHEIDDTRKNIIRMSKETELNTTLEGGLAGEIKESKVPTKRKREIIYDAETIYNISKLALKFCPYSDFCFMNRTDTLSEVEGVPCCKHCYCDAACGERMDCCFDFLDKVRIPETNNFKCIQPLVERSDETFVYTNSYYMVDTCLENASRSCRNVTSALWGQIYPVFSPTSKLIYYNQHCALCNHIGDAIPWGVYINCHGTDTIIGTGLLDSLTNGRCEVTFQPQDTRDTDKFICSADVIATCSTTTGLNYGHMPLEEACALTRAEMKHPSGNGIMTYANIFCKLCEENYKKPHRVCFEHDRKGPQTNSFTALLDWEMFSSNIILPKNDFHGNKTGLCEPNEFRHPTKNECRAILCPIGTIRTIEGCILYTKRWYKQGYLMHLILTPASEHYILHVDALRRVIAEKEPRVNHWLDSKGIKVNSILVYGEIVVTGNVSYVRTMNMIIGVAKYPLFPEEVLNTVKMSLSKQWRIFVDNDKYFYDVKFDNYLFYIQSGTQSRVLTNSLIQEPEVLPKLYDQIYRNEKPILPFYITKLFFCDLYPF